MPMHSRISKPVIGKLPSTLTRDDPWPPKLVGVAINLLFQTVMIQSLRKMQKQLKQEASERRQ